MRPSVKIALIFVAIWFSGKMLFFGLQILQTPELYKFQVMWNILCLLLGMSIGTLMEIRTEDRSQSTALGDIKKAMTGGVVYTILVSGLLYLYYAQIDPGYNRQQIAMSAERDEKYLSNPKNLAEIQQLPEFQSLTKAEILDKRLTGYIGAFNAKTTFTMSLMGLLVLSTINSIILTVIYRRILFKQRTI